MSTPSPSAGAAPGVSIVDTNALTGALRTLKLGGMLQTLDARLAQARAGELGHLEFLQVLCLDEISRRETTAIARRTRRPRRIDRNNMTTSGNTTDSRSNRG